MQVIWGGVLEKWRSFNWKWRRGTGIKKKEREKGKITLRKFEKKNNKKSYYIYLPKCHKILIRIQKEVMLPELTMFPTTLM